MGRGAIVALVASLALGCSSSDGSASRQDAPKDVPRATSSTDAQPSASAASPNPASSAVVPAPVSVIAGGDVYFGRFVGKRLLADPKLDLLTAIQPWLDSADLRFVNLECQLSDQKGVTVHPDNQLVFVGPPSGAEALKRARIDLVSLANNHMWDFGKDALFETFEHLERVGVDYVGAGRTEARAYGHVVHDVKGRKLAFVAVTDIWNQGPLKIHPARTYVSRADPQRIREQVAAAREEADLVLVSYHGGSEYLAGPTMYVREVLHAAVEAGADVVIGHHPHVMQGIGWYRGVPILYSIGNVTMGAHVDHSWSRYGALARLTFPSEGRVPEVELCPFGIRASSPTPLLEEGGEPAAAMFFQKVRALSGHVAGSDLDSPGPDGCARVRPPSHPVPGGIP